MKKRILALTLVFALAFTICALFTGCGEKPSGPNPDPTQKPVKATVLRASTPTAPDHPWTLGLQKIAEDVSERTGGRYKIDVYPNASLSEGSEKTMTEQIYTGTIDMGVSPASLCSTIFSCFGFPFSYDDRDHIARVCDSEIAKEMLATLEEKGMHAIAFVENGFRQITNNVHEVKVPADAKGIKIRTPQSATTIACMEAIGFDTVAISAGELYVALSQGTANGQENALSTIYNNKYYEVQKYLTVINYNWSPALIGINSELWESLSSEDKAIFEEVINDSAAYVNELLAAQDEDFIKKLEEAGMQIYICTPDDIAQFREAVVTESLKDTYRGVVGEDIMNRFFQTIEDTRSK
ncbi:MAG: TRAP transporter substrate-binding protein [Clostridiales bacterium]|nr:TRAP transporter substrate-binding protein [Clostridiales bacterium]